MVKVRIDKWLWAARFFKTRALAKSAIENGRIHIDGQKCKPSRLIGIGEYVKIRQGDVEKIVKVSGVSEHRGGATDAQMLYKETLESIAEREQKAADRKAFYGSTPISTRPSKKERRQIHRFLEN
jgi:ribosome-associated heat shock protein Hsp15